MFPLQQIHWLPSHLHCTTPALPLRSASGTVVAGGARERSAVQVLRPSGSNPLHDEEIASSGLGMPEKHGLLDPPRNDGRGRDER